MRTLRTTAVACVAVIALAGVAAAADPLALDDTFSADGWTTFDLGDPDGHGARDMAAVGTGVVLVGADAASDAAVLQVAAAGDLDPAFGGGDGVATIENGGREFANAVGVDGLGRIVVAGGTGAFGQRLMVARLEPDGDPDPTFGGGDGIFVWRRAPAGEDLAITASGNIVVVGTFGSPTKALVLRLTDAGVFDNTFGGSDGWMTTSFGDTAAFSGVALDARGRIVAVGQTTTAAAGTDVAIARVRRDGTFDPRFSGDGRATVDLGDRYDRGSAVAIQDDGKIVVAGGTYSDVDDDNDPLLVRFRADGGLDTTFGVNGRRRLNLSADNEWFDDVLVEPDGDLSMAGTAGVDAIVASSTPDGLAITYRIKDFAGGSDRGTAIARRDDGKLWVAGTITSTTVRYGLARYLPA